MRPFYKLVWIQNSAHWSRLLCNCQLFFEEVKMRNLLRRNRTVWVNSMKLCRQPPGQPQPTMFVHNVRLEVEKVLCCACESGGCGHTNWFFYICTRPWMCKEWDPQYENLINKTTAPTTDRHGWLLLGWLLPSPAHCAWGPVGDWCRNPDAGTLMQEPRDRWGFLRICFCFCSDKLMLMRFLESLSWRICFHVERDLQVVNCLMVKWEGEL